MAAPEVNETKIMFPEEQVGGYTFRPWSLEQFGRLLGVLMTLVKVFEDLGLEAERTEQLLNDPQAAMTLLPSLTPLFPEIIEITLNLPREEVDNIEMGTKMALGLRILNNPENQKQLKNFFGGLLGLQESPPNSTH